MAHRARASRWPLAVVACIACAALAHFALRAGASGPVWAAVLAAPVIAWAGWLAAETRSRALWILLPLALIAAIFFLERWDRLGFALAYGLPHAAAYLLLLWYFGRSLRAGREPVITRLARRIRGTLSEKLERYTRALTLAWCVFFTAQLAASAALLAFAPLETWSFFVNVLNVPLITAMFAGDYAYRIIRFRGERITPISRIWRAFIEDAASSGASPR